ncbi:MAG: hypothetical protein AMJ81_11565, partial [Phycisphaerae bacterium SM23_33]
SDTILDASPAETAAGSVHVITKFYQPYTDSASDSDYVSLEIAGQDLRDPTITSSASGYSDFSSQPVFADGPEYEDIRQGAVGDCYLLASLASLAQFDPGIIQQMVAPLGDGTFAVRFYRNGESVYVRVDGDLPVRSTGLLAYASLSRDGEMWVPLVEKAYTYFRYGQNSYSSIGGGWMSVVYAEVTNQASGVKWVSGTESELYEYLRSHMDAGHALTMGSCSTAPAPIIGSHAYMVNSVQATDSGYFVTVYNPWGCDGKSWDANYSDGLLTLSMEQVLQSFSAICVCMA